MSRAEGNRSRRETNQAELVWQMWYGYSPEDAAERVGVSARTLQRHITALLDAVGPHDAVTAEVVDRLRRRSAHAGQGSGQWWQEDAVSAPRTGRPFHNYAYGQSRPDLRPAIPEVTDQEARLAAVAAAVARLTTAVAS